MSEIKELVEAIAGLPHLAIWAIAIFYAYKVAVVGSIYGVIRFVATKTAEVLTREKPVPVQVVKWDGAGIEAVQPAAEPLRHLLMNRVRSGARIGSNYLHECDVRNLSEAWDDWLAKKERERLQGAGK